MKRLLENKKKVLVIGLDGVTLDVLMPWIKEGKLPNFKSLIEDGASGPLLSSTPPLSPIAWTSFMTGKNPGKHGIFDFTERRPNSYEITFVNSERVDGDILWSVLGKAGKKVGVINVTVTYPPHEVNGFLVSGILTPSRKSSFTFPKSLRSELVRVVGNYRFDVEEEFGKDREDFFLKDLYNVTKVREKATLYLINKFDWDFFMVMFYGTELVQNKFWSYMDCTHPDHDPEMAKKYGNVILEYFQRIDQIIGKILKNVDENVIVFVMSDHGHGPLHKVFYVNRWLMELGLLKFKGNVLVRTKIWLCKLNLPMRIYNLLTKIGLGKLKNVASLGRQINIVNAFLSFRDIDWSQTKAYSHGHIGRIFINLKGREPNGIVEPGKEYQKLREYIIKKLYELRDPETDEKLVDRVFMKEEIYQGPHVDEAPDIIFHMKDMKYVTEFGSYGFHTASLFGRSILMDSGAHRPKGILIVQGENANKHHKIENAKIIDVAPTILYIMGIPIPSDMDGRVLTEIFNPVHLKSHPIRYREKGTLEEAEPFEWSKKQEEIIKERLKRLGYLG